MMMTNMHFLLGRGTQSFKFFCTELGSTQDKTEQCRFTTLAVAQHFLPISPTSEVAEVSRDSAEQTQIYHIF